MFLFFFHFHFHFPYLPLLLGVTTIVRTEGISGVYRGLVPTFLKQSTNQGVRFVVYEKLKALMTVCVFFFLAGRGERERAREKNTEGNEERGERVVMASMLLDCFLF